MDRNDYSRFSEAPSVDIPRSSFNRNSTVKTSFNVGQIIPVYLDEVLPGDTFKVSTAKIARMQTLKTPMMSDIFMDTYWFYVPARILWDHFEEFMGANKTSAWIPQAQYTIPQITSPDSTGWSVGSIADYLGIPVGVPNLSVNALPFRAYARIVNDWFVAETLSDPLVIETGDSTVTGSNGSTFVTDVAKGGMPYIAAKTFDYFTSCLPAPQRGPAVSLSMSASTLPVFTQKMPNDHYWPTTGSASARLEAYTDNLEDAYPLYFETSNPMVSGVNQYPAPLAFTSTTDKTAADNWGASYLSTYTTGGKDYSVLQSVVDSDGHSVLSADTMSEITRILNNGQSAITPVNLIASNAANMTTINELRQAFQIQRFYEKAARAGSGRYIEILDAQFGVTSPDARLQRAEYLGGSRLPLSIRQITQTSSTTGNQPLGDVAGMSVTTDNHFEFEKSFVEHGYIIGLVVARYDHSYQQGIDPLFQRKSMFDFYWPSFAHLGEMAVSNKTLYATGTYTDDEVFGYQEAWAEYRYKPNRITGMMRSASNSGLDSWHLADDYDSLPYLSSEWIMEDMTNVDRVLTVTSSVSDQIFMDMLVENKTTRPMPLYSIPGLIDHF